MAHLEISPQVLSCLAQVDGTADFQARKAKLMDLVKNHLSINELRFFKDLLSTVTFQKDIIASVPIEIVAIVSTYLDCWDIFTCLAVSKLWNHKFKSHQVIFALTRQFFPLVAWESQRAGHKDQESQDRLCSSFLQLHLPARLKWNAMQVSKESTARRYCWDNEMRYIVEGKDYSHFAGIANIRRDARYAHGRIAWQSELHTLVVDSLHTRTRRIMDVPRGKLLGPRISLVALGDKLVVATMDRNLFAWDFSTTQFERTTLPGIPGPHCTTLGNQVVIAVGKTLYAWQFGGPMRALDLSDLDAPSYPTAIIHPHIKGVMYVNLGYTTTQEGVKVTLYKFENGKLDGAFHIDVSANLRSYMGKIEDLSICSIQREMVKTDSYGSYFVLGFRFRWHTIAPGFDNKSDTPRRPKERAWQLGEHCILQFNIYNETFSKIDVHPIDVSQFSFCVWNNLVFHAKKVDDVYEEEEGTSISVVRTWPKPCHYQDKHYLGKIHGEIRYSPEMPIVVDENFMVVLHNNVYVTWNLKN